MIKFAGTYEIIRRTRGEDGKPARVVAATVDCDSRKQAKRFAADLRQPGDLGRPTVRFKKAAKKKAGRKKKKR